MTPELWQKVQEKLTAALALPADQRAAFLESLAAESNELHDEVGSLLAQEPAIGKFLDTGSSRDLHRDTGERDTLIGRRLGAYRITSLLGEGGMGEVYRALRVDDRFEKEVAIKVVRAGRDSRLVADRFRSERQILAGLSHTNIAHLLDGGEDQDGTPYIVMELVAGEPITDYCRRLGLDFAQRLELFLSVCAAVQYAHQRLIVHRDLKPGNILVTADGVPKLLDFGIAKLLDIEPLAQSPDPTMTSLRALTPAYASPEQIRGESITTAGDVYSLGVVLYELLTGVSPYRAISGTAAELARAVCEAEPERPSIAVRRAAGQATATATLPDSTTQRQVRRLRGDIDAIVLKALRKEPGRRYATVDQFAADIRRFLAAQPVLARRGTRRYRFSKFVARHAVAVATAAVAGFVVLAAVLGVLREARIAERRFDDVRQLTHSMIFDVHDAIKSIPGSTPARKLIIESALEYLRRIGDEAQGDIALQRELASSYERVALVQGQYLQSSLGDTKGSLDSYQRAYALRARVAAATRNWQDKLALANAGGLVAVQQFALGQNAEARAGIAPALAAIDTIAVEHPGEPSVLLALSYTYEFAAEIADGDARAQEQYLQKSTEADAGLMALQPDNLTALDRTATGLANYGELVQKRDLQSALAIFQRALEIIQKVHAQAPAIAQYARDVAVAYSRLGNIYRSLDDAQRSFDNFEQGLQISKSLAHDDPQNTLFQQGLAIAYANAADALCAIKPAAKCLDYADESVKIIRVLAGRDPGNKRIAYYHGVLRGVRAATLLVLRRWDDALTEFANATKIIQPSGDAIPSADSPLAAWRQQMGQAAAQSGLVQLADRYFKEVLAAIEPALLNTTPDDDLLTVVADTYAWQGQLQMQEARRTDRPAAERRAHWVSAQGYYRQSEAAWRRAKRPHFKELDPFGVGDPERVAHSLELCDAALAAHGPTGP